MNSHTSYYKLSKESLRVRILSKGQGETVYGGQGHGRKIFEKPDISQKLCELDESFFCLVFVN